MSKKVYQPASDPLYNETFREYKRLQVTEETKVQPTDVTQPKPRSLVAIETEIQNGILIVKIPLHKPTLANSGKCFVVANCGFQPTPLKIDDKTVSVAITAIINK